MWVKAGVYLQWGTKLSNWESPRKHPGLCLHVKFSIHRESENMKVTCPISTACLAPCSWTRSHVTCQCQPNLKPWRNLPSASAHCSLWHPVHLNHLIPSCRGMVITHFVKRNALSRLSPPAWALAPIWYGNTFFHNISSVLCSVNSKPTRCCSVKAVMLCSGSVTELFGSLDAAQTSHTLAGVFHDSLYKSRKDFGHPSANQLQLPSLSLLLS